jgi:hypothetical protein
MQEADQQAWNFVTCICDSNWKAGTPDQIRSSVPVCPAIPGITKGQQASVGADCHGSSVSQKMKVIQSFGLRTFVKGKPYVPLSGFPPGVLSSDVSYSWISTFLIPAVLVFF